MAKNVIVYLNILIVKVAEYLAVKELRTSSCVDEYSSSTTFGTTIGTTSLSGDGAIQPF